MKVRTFIPIFLVFVVGLSLLLYPFVANEWNTYRQSTLLTSYNDVIRNAENSGQVDYQTEWDKANQFNQDLLPSILPDSFAIAEAKGGMDAGYLSCLNLIGDGMMGSVEVPKIKITLPVFHGTETETLQIAAGHLEGSSLPVGGQDTHAVISAHRGLPSAALFTDLDKLEIGDYFVIHVLDADLYYEVDQINVVEPDQTDALSVVKGMDLVTLLTCTPYGVNTHRLLVRGHRISAIELPQTKTNIVEAITNTSLHTNYLLWVVVGLGTVVLAYFIMTVVDLNRRRIRNKKRMKESGIADETQNT